MTALLKRNLPAGVEAVVPAYRSLSILYDPLATAPTVLAEILHALEADFCAAGIAEAKVVPIPVCYGGEFGPDIGVVKEHKSLQEDEIVAIHASVDCPIYMIGFTPGFCYLGGLDRRLQTPRRKTPRTNLPAGSVGIAESQTGMYSVDSPGGCQIIERTPLRLFAPRGKTPFCTSRETVSGSCPSPRPSSAGCTKRSGPDGALRRPEPRSHDDRAGSRAVCWIAPVSFPKNGFRTMRERSRSGPFPAHRTTPSGKASAPPMK